MTTGGSYRVERLAADHGLHRFRSGNLSLDGWLRDHAADAAGRGTRTFVLVEAASGAVVGYFSVAPYLVAAADVPRAIGRGAPRQIPAILLARLAVDGAHQGQGAGGVLLAHALDRIVRAAREGGGRLVVVDAIDDRAAGFYRHHGFRAVPGDDRRLVLRLSSAARSLGVPWP